MSSTTPFLSDTALLTGITFLQLFASKFFFNVTKSSGDGSIATTLPSGPTSFDGNNANSPIPVPISITVLPS